MSKQTHSDHDTMLALDIRKMIDNGDLTLKPVDSTNIQHEAYWPDEQILVLVFPTGTYAYQGLPPSHYNQFLKAKSKGSFFAREIRDLYPFIKIPTPVPQIDPQLSHSLAVI